MLVQGGGYIAVEFAAIFNGLGAEVTLVYRGENILRGFDDDLRAHLRTEMERRGIRILTGQTVAGVEAAQGLVPGAAVGRRGGRGRQGHVRHRPASQCRRLRARGRRRAARRQWRHRGRRVLARPRVPHIHAVGDVTNRINLTPVAIREGHAFADTVFGNKPTRVDHADVPTAVFSEPEIGTVGLTAGAGLRVARQGRHLQDHVPAHEGDARRAATRARS